MTIPTLTQLKNLAYPYRKLILAAGIIIGILLMWYGVSKFIDWLHDVNYEHQQDADKTAANNAEANANTHEADANRAADNRKELEQNENTIRNERTNQQGILTNSKQQADRTRDRLNEALNTSVPVRDPATDPDDDQLRSDSDAARSAFNANRN